MAFLVFQLKAPLASFGVTLGEHRGTDLRPRKSAVLGMVAAALGVERTEPTRFQKLFDLKFAVLELKAPTVLRDFHTVQAPFRASATTRRDQLASGEPNTMLTPRDYLQDGHWLVALEGTSEDLAPLARALENPVFTLFLGRKACPLSRFTAPLIDDKAQCVAGAMTEWLGAHRVAAPSNASLSWEPGMTCSRPAEVQRSVRDVRHSLVQPHFSSRLENEGSFSAQDN